MPHNEGHYHVVDLTDPAAKSDGHPADPQRHTSFYYSSPVTAISTSVSDTEI